MRLRIVSDGTRGGTRVFLAETGEELLVTAATWELDCNKDGLAHVSLSLPGHLVELDVIGEGEAVAHDPDSELGGYDNPYPEAS